MNQNWIFLDDSTVFSEAVRRRKNHANEREGVFGEAE